ncbi:MAG: PrsW family glutamic-type intramembrane protease [Candidatus Thermoplasmatota archaeon]|nr:PrsW family glutamic-type intramembrane protease [Candidatus Thermoplasmatota archaeon]
MNSFFGIMFGFLAIILPLVSLIGWVFLFTRFFHYSREVFPKSIFLRGWGSTARYISLGLLPLFMSAASIVSASISIIFELLVSIIVILIFSGGSNVTLLTVTMSAGPIEESAKLLCAGLLYMTVYLIWRKRPEMSKERNRVKDGLLIGLIAGASFGLLESVLYLFAGFDIFMNQPISLFTVDPILWRFVLGVSIHALYTGIASAGLGRSSFRSKVAYTLIFLPVAVVLHSLNNGVQGFFIYVLDMDGTAGLIIIDILQILLILIGCGVFILLWKMAGKGRTSKEKW